MDDKLYDTSLTLYAVTDSSLPYRNLLSAHQGALSARAIKLREHLSRRPKYEKEEETEKLGGLRDCTWTTFRGDRCGRTDADEVAIILTYDKAVYKFILYSNASSARPGSRTELPLLLAKASAATSRLFLSFLVENFHVIVSPLKLPASFLSTSISEYIATIYTSFGTASDTRSMLSLLKDTVGNLKLGVTINTASANGADIAQHLRNMDVDVPAETLYQLLSSDPPQSSGNTSPQSSFLPSLQHHIRQRTGLNLPLLPEDNAIDDTNEPPLKLSRVSSVAFALSTEGRLKFSSRACEAVDAVPGLKSGNDNVVKTANTQLLEAIVAEVLKNG